ncbi:LuxR family transcriptional regulator [Duganella callida]|uniref:LuxR family transcriptional regulator n=1 Tax=Duganella callida TaxID=2561932 RepID=A0A4Y9SX17_9BURK|nr:LuxR family transcriptional regulator [Duganella callida]
MADGMINGFSGLFESLTDASCEADAILRLQSGVQGLGFDRVMFAVIPQPKVSLSDVYMRSNYPTRWREQYDRDNLRAADPTVEHCFKASSPFIWMPQSFQGDQQHALYEEASSHGLKAGVTLPIHGSSGEIGMLTCVRDQAPGNGFINDLHQQLGQLTLLRDLAFDTMRPYMHAPPPSQEVPALTARELDCLQWMAAGKTAWEIGRILSISEAGVNFHIGNLRTKFGVSRRNDVVIKAIRFGLITLPG